MFRGNSGIGLHAGSSALNQNLPKSFLYFSFVNVNISRLILKLFKMLLDPYSKDLRLVIPGDMCTLN